MSRSKTISGNKESTEQQRHRSRPTVRATARNCCRLEKSYSGTASWPHSMGIRRTASSQGRASTVTISRWSRRCRLSGP